jgi:nickel/cobalt exporter
VLRARLRRRHVHHHHHPHEERNLRSLLAVGISGGLLPCPTALVVLLAAISLHRVGYGLVLIVAFSLGLAGAMTAVGLAAVSARRFLRKKSFDGRVVRALPAVSAALILALGLAMTTRALPGVL